MPTRLCLGVALLLSLALAAFARADDRPSHRPIRSGLDEDLKPEDRLNQRLAALRLLRQAGLDDGKFDGDIQQLARKLMMDKGFMDSVRKSLTADDIDRLKKRMDAEGKSGLASDPAIQKLLRQGLKNATLGDADKDLLKKWAKRNPPGPDGKGSDGPPGKDDPPPDHPPDQPPDQAGKSPPATGGSEDRGAWQRFFERGDSWMNRQLDRWAGDVSRWFDTRTGKRWQNTLTNLGKRALEAKAITGQWSERTKAAVGWLPRLTETLPSGGIGRLPGGNLPSVGSLPSAPSVGAGDVASAGKVVLVLAFFGVVALVVWRLAGGWIADRLSDAVTGWRLGPWPVRPEAVASKGDLVRAFEYLALLALGPVARSWNHLEVGQRLGEQPALDADRRREAADRLALLYEQARYAPEQDPLAADELETARRELCYLAGVPSA